METVSPLAGEGTRHTFVFHPPSACTLQLKKDYKLLLFVFSLSKNINTIERWFASQDTCNRQLLDEVFVISGIIKVEVSVICRSRRLRLVTLTETLIIPDITKTESNNFFIILYLQVISQFLAGSMKRIEKPFLHRCPRT